MLDTVLKILGLASGQSMTNTVGGIATHAAFIPVILWLLTHMSESVSFNTSYGFLALIAGIAYFVLEILRRSRGSNSP